MFQESVTFLFRDVELFLHKFSQWEKKYPTGEKHWLIDQETPLTSSEGDLAPVFEGDLLAAGIITFW